MIANSGHDERGKFSGGQAGDQSGTEWQIQKWYNRPWNWVFRYPREDVAEMIASLAEEAAKNNKIGYDQNQRTTFWTQLSKVGYHPKNITVPCEADCSAGVAALVKATGYLLNISELKNVSKDMYTGSEKKILIEAGFSAFGDQAITGGEGYLRRGDILLCEGHHTAINLTDGIYINDKDHWVHVGGDWFYQNKFGENTKGWALIKETKGNYSHWYYFDASGRMVKGWKWINDKLYLFMPSGDLEGAMCVTDTTGNQSPQNIIE